MSENQSPNKGKPIFFENELHYIVYEFSVNILISKNQDLSKVFCVPKTKTSVKENNQVTKKPKSKDK